MSIIRAVAFEEFKFLRVIAHVSVVNRWQLGVQMKTSKRNRIKGAAKEANGRLKEAAGHATRSRRLARRGRVEATRGRLRRKTGELQEDLEAASKY